MKRNASKTLLAVLVIVVLGLFILNPGLVIADCGLVCEGNYVIDNIDTAGDLEALSGCTSITGDLAVVNPPLTTLEGLECLTYVEGDVEFVWNDSLTNLRGLESLESVGTLWINFNSSLTSLKGLESLVYAGNLLIQGNFSLTSLQGTDSLEYVGNNLVIGANIELCTSLAEVLRYQVLDAGGIGGSTYISDNKPGC